MVPYTIFCNFRDLLRCYDVINLKKNPKNEYYDFYWYFDNIKHQKLFQAGFHLLKSQKNFAT